MQVEEAKAKLDVLREWMREVGFFALLLAEFDIASALAGLVGVYFVTQKEKGAVIFLPTRYHHHDEPVRAARAAGWAVVFQNDPREIAVNVFSDLPKVRGKQKHIAIDPAFPPEGQATLVGLLQPQSVWLAVAVLEKAKKQSLLAKLAEVT